MTELWYRGFMTYGYPYQVARMIAEEIRKNKLGNIMQRICVEPSRKRGELYFFIGIQSERFGELPYEVRQFVMWLNLNRIFTFQGGEALTTDELTQGWLKREIDITYTRQVTWRVFQQEGEPENPFDLSEIPQPNETSRQTYNHLLYWLSANGEGSWQSFRSACERLGLNQQDEPRHIFRRLRLLGHIEYLDEGKRWAICPPCLVNIESLDNSCEYFLAGGRTPKLIESLVNVRSFPQAGRGGPDIIRIIFSTKEEALSVISEIRKTDVSISLVGQTSLRLAGALPDLMEWKQALLKPILIAPERFRIHQWDGQSFSLWVDRPVETGWYQLEEPETDYKALRFYYFYDSDQRSWLQGDYYGLRFLANWHIGIHAQLAYHPKARLLSVPTDQHLPDLYERALILASGELPSTLGNFLLYKNIPEQLAQILREKLDASMEIKRL